MRRYLERGQPPEMLFIFNVYNKEYDIQDEGKAEGKVND
jgi:hypothetical protein